MGLASLTLNSEDAIVDTTRVAPYLAEPRHLATLLLHLASRDRALGKILWAEQLQGEAQPRKGANTTRGLLAEYIVATAVGTLKTKRVEWDKHDLNIDSIGVEVKSAAYVQSWKQTGPSVISFDIGPKTGWDAGANTCRCRGRFGSGHC